MSVARGYVDRGLPISTIVIDWQHWVNQGCVAGRSGSSRGSHVNKPTRGPQRAIYRKATALHAVLFRHQRK